ncbi:multi-sensor signal transduction histidine kinase [Nostoc commune NIES-4072]|uniref:histidine kinase n=1 Tax=Nostoc commune NIES-4072 TaxID=2005467 RepID=A0A2R5FEZ2_NOSCO|nr:GAF domain-containing protein [Nostoc commune]BBD65636.1 multi-sensor signal transduction histidine kinase [Nostoc commune HK-02]GBG17040.1 multi-sensor signal transduction histidine kinase [Nostoc commune NIES-4072]
MKAEQIDTEMARLEALRQYQILDTEPEEAYDNLAQLAAFICGTPISLVNFIDENRQWFKAKVGLNVSEMPRTVGLSYLCQERRNVVVVPDTLADEKLANNAVVIGYPHVRFYAGVPLITPKGDMLGTLCVIDQVPRELNQEQVEALVALSRLVIDQLELRRHVTEVSQVTEKLMAHQQAAHAESESARIRIANLLESITDAFFALDKKWRFTYINGQAELLLQKTQNELLGQSIWEVFPELIDTTFHREYQRAMLEQVSVEFEEFYQPLNCWLQVHAYPAKDGLSVYFQDITERRRTAEALRESEERWQLALNGNNDGIWDWNLKTNEVFFSTRWKEMLGYKDHEVSDGWDEWTKLIHPDERDWVLQVFQDHFAKKIPFYVCEYRVQCQDGSYKWILDRGQALWDASGDIVRMVGSYTDITDRKQADEELKRQNLRSQLFAEITLKIRESLQINKILQTTVTEVQKLLQADRVLIFQIEPDGSGTVVQEAVLPGWPVILGKNIFDPCFKEEYIERYRQGRVSAMEDIQAAHIQPCHREFLQQFAVRANLVVPILVRESIWGLLLAHQCSAPRRWNNFETELLKQLANQIGIALSQAQLLEKETQQSQELARSNAELEQFAYVASHDLQEPLRMVTSYLQLLERRYKNQLDTNADQFINYAVDGARRMQTLINDLLNYSRVSTRGQPFIPVNCSIVLEQAIANLQIAISDSKAIITHDPLPEVMADVTQLIQVFQNLIGNAIKFCRHQQPQIHIGVAKPNGNLDGESLNVIPSVDEWLFWVRDNGIGLESQYAERIFIIFQRLHGRDKYPGTGIGLAICKKIIERHGGRIWVESKLGEGSTFYFTIPDRAGKQSWAS